MPVIRRGHAGDLAAVASIQATSPEASQWPPADYLDYEFSVAVSNDGALAGFVVWRRLAADECELLNLVVAPEFRRNGVARELLRPLLNRGATSFYLEVRESNETARSFYKSMGFQEVSLRRGYYKIPPESAIVMKFHSC